MSYKEVWETLKREFKGKAVEYGKCQYKTCDDKKCAIGCFLPDGYYATVRIEKLLSNRPDLMVHMPHKDIDILNKWQFFHDNLDDRYNIKEQRAALFNKYVTLTKEYK